MNHQIIAAIALGNAIRALDGYDYEKAVAIAIVTLTQLDPGLSERDASGYVLAALSEIANITFRLCDIQAEAKNMGIHIPVQ